MTPSPTLSSIRRNCMHLLPSRQDTQKVAGNLELGAHDEPPKSSGTKIGGSPLSSRRHDLVSLYVSIAANQIIQTSFPNQVGFKYEVTYMKSTKRVHGTGLSRGYI